jgi:myo-inositol 2-dehydrogenase/D-chiro-inositol 1-dehydrogenase
LTAIAESDATSREAAHRCAPGARALADYRALLEQKDVEAVVVALPSDQHALAARAALDAGKHVYLEKPLATNLADAEAVVRAWRAADRIGMIGFNYRFNKLYRRARQLIREGFVGDPVAVRSVFAMAAHPLPVWKTRRATGGGVLLDLASHHFDLIRFWFDTEIDDVSCDVESRLTEDDTAFVRLRLANGASVQSFFSLCATDEDRFEIYGTAGMMRIDRCHAMDVEQCGPGADTHRGDQVRHWMRSLRGIGYGLARQRAFGHEPSWQVALEHFVDAVRTGRPAAPDFQDGYESLKIVVAAEQAATITRRQPA